MDKKSPPLLSRSIFNPTHYSLPFLFLFLAVEMDLVGNAVGEIWACQLSPKTAKNYGRVYFYVSQLPVVCVTTPGCACASRKKIHGDNEKIHGDYKTRRLHAGQECNQHQRRRQRRWETIACYAQPMMRRFMLISRGKKSKSSLLKKTFFSNTVCPVGFFAPAKTPNGTF